MSNQVHYCGKCGNVEVEVMVWATWNVPDQAWGFVSEDGAGMTYCDQCEENEVRVYSGPLEEALKVAEYAKALKVAEYTETEDEDE
ncbi:MAG: hypothetical protein EOO16_03250 [Chitinophagaceae bacterium]|nr:MAG: hypothetical protein EOO16_03250 [Chitinophagaceae bacterium]